jgi:hypothetical protein
MRFLTVITVAAVLLSTTTAAPAAAVEGVGEAMAVIDTAGASGQSGGRTLAVGSKVFAGDLVTTDADGSVQLLFSDGTRMVVGADSSLRIDALRFGGHTSENSTGNQFAVFAVAGSFRFISGDSGDRGYSIRTPTARIDVRGTVLDFTVTPEGETKMVLLEGEAALCNEDDEDGENGEDDDCVTVATPCALLQTESGEDVEEVEAGNRRVEETREHFPFVTSDSNLLEEFRVAGHGCADGGLSEFALDRSGIKLPHVALGVGLILCLVFCLPDGDSNNSTN